MTKTLFDWKEWDDLDCLSVCFYDVTLKVKIGSHKVGEQFDSIVIDYAKGKLELYKDGSGTHESYELSLQVSEKIYT